MNIQERLQKTQKFLSSSMSEGWLPYAFVRAKSPSIEATAWSAIALISSNPAVASKAISFILKNQNNDGGWSTSPAVEKSDWNTSLALLALRFAKYYQLEDLDEKSMNKAIKNGVHYLITSRMDLMIPVLRLLLLMGAKGKEGLQFGKGWPWNKGCYSWVEPTAYSLMALKLPTTIDDDLTKIAITHANKFLLDHACKGGGWNHGAYYCLGEYCPPYTLTTAEATLALFDVKDNEKINLALNILSNTHHRAISAWSTAWNIMALDAHGKDCSQNIDMLLGLQNKNGSFGSNFLVTALSLLALNTTTGVNIFKTGDTKLVPAI
jgi:hypothetical protein